MRTYARRHVMTLAAAGLAMSVCPLPTVGGLGAQTIDPLFRFLHDDHSRIGALFSTLTATDDLAVRTDAFTQLQRILHAHMTIEENVFYPALRRESAHGSELAEEARLEHREARRVLHELQKLPLAAPNWIQACARLADEVLQHVREEERDMFVYADRVFGEAEAAALLRQMRRLHDRLT